MEVAVSTLGKVKGRVRWEEGVESCEQQLRLWNLKSTKETSKDTCMGGGGSRWKETT